MIRTIIYSFGVGMSFVGILVTTGSLALALGFIFIAASFIPGPT